MDLVSIRIITDDVQRLVTFYEQATGVVAVWANDLFAELSTPSGTLAIGSSKTVPLFGAGCAESGANRSVIIEFLVEDVDQLHPKLTPLTEDVVQEPTTMPWGNRSLLVRDPDGNLVNFFTPVSDDAKQKFGVGARG